MNRSENIRKHCYELYDKMVALIESCANTHNDNQCRIECCFHAAKLTRTELDIIIVNYSFIDNEEEIWFFKTMKPQFSALEEFFILLYKGCLFCPFDEKDTIKFLKDELERVKKFFRIHESLYIYYKLNKNERDTEYFLRKELFESDLPAWYDYKPGACSACDHLIAAFMAREKYVHHLLSELNSFNL